MRVKITSRAPLRPPARRRPPAAHPRGDPAPRGPHRHGGRPRRRAVGPHREGRGRRRLLAGERRVVGPVSRDRRLAPDAPGEGASRVRADHPPRVPLVRARGADARPHRCCFAAGPRRGPPYHECRPDVQLRDLEQVPGAPLVEESNKVRYKMTFTITPNAGRLYVLYSTL